MEAAFNEVSARALVTRVVQAHEHLFRAFADLQRDDLVSFGVDVLRAAYPTYDQRRGSFSNWVHQIVPRRLKSLLRDRGRAAAREARYAAARPEFVPPAAIHFAEWDHDKPIAEWLRDVYDAAKRVYRPQDYRRRTGCPRTYSVAQMVAVATLAYRLKLTCRGVALELADRPDLREACRLPRAPSYRHIYRAMVTFRSFRRDVIDPVMGVPDPSIDRAAVAARIARELSSGGE